MPINIWGPLTIAFLLGILWRLFARSSRAYRSKMRSYPSRWAFFLANWDVFLLRTVPFNSALFVTWLFHPMWLSAVLIHFYVPANIANWIDVTPTLGSAAVFGFLIDYFLDQIQLRIATTQLPSWIPDAIKGEIPAYDTAIINGNMSLQNKRDTGMDTSLTNKVNGKA